MEASQWLAEHWLDLVQTIGIITFRDIKLLIGP
jgi:hypothetical protein